MRLFIYFWINDYILTMKRHSTNYFNTFIETAEDAQTKTGIIPVAKNDKPTVASMQYELISQHPYQYTSDDVLFRVYTERNNIDKKELKAARENFFSKGQPCFRASPLTKTYGWGVHSNAEGKIALYGHETKEYQQFCQDEDIKKVKAMKSKK